MSAKVLAKIKLNIHFLSINYIKEKEDFLAFDFSAFNI